MTCSACAFLQNRLSSSGSTRSAGRPSSDAMSRTCAWTALTSELAWAANSCCSATYVPVSAVMSGNVPTTGSSPPPSAPTKRSVAAAISQNASTLLAGGTAVVASSPLDVLAWWAATSSGSLARAAPRIRPTLPEGFGTLRAVLIAASASTTFWSACCPGRRMDSTMAATSFFCLYAVGSAPPLAAFQASTALISSTAQGVCAKAFESSVVRSA
mmetsp:Transcript_27750/g.70771  ORF Transcript_27750/g.70771 Transcript_27750/m.70771 type:complete len:214 (-) Transcript_27750:590-1231(-)